MSSVKTTHPSQNRKLQSGTAIYGTNGLPIDSIAELSGSIQLVRNDTTPLLYSAGVVTVPSGTDLNLVKFHKSVYTGRMVLIDAAGKYYFISRPSINPSAYTFNIYDTADELSYPLSIDLSAGWVLAEAQLVNRLATTNTAKIDQVSFRDFQVQFNLDGDPVRIVDRDGDELNINPDGSLPFTDGSSVSQPTVMNVPLTLASNEYQIILPSNTKRYLLRVRNGSSTLKVGYASVSSSPYLTVERGASYSEDKIARGTDLDLFVQAAKDNQILELIYWT